MPWASRSSTRSTGASAPTVAAVGRSPLSTVATPIISSDTTSMGLRPSRSPKWPKTIPPSGRARNPAPNVANASIVPRNGPTSGKNSRGKTSAAAVP
jgi:hypothetical protein